VECAWAAARLERDGALDAKGVIEAFDRLNGFADGWHEVDPSDATREAAVRFLRAILCARPRPFSSPRRSSQRNDGRTQGRLRAD
jgi:hypothetical protein